MNDITLLKNAITTATAELEAARNKLNEAEMAYCTATGSSANLFFISQTNAQPRTNFDAVRIKTDC
ncbi:MAG: hypothetical protein Q7R60_01040 [bacterium]|nr:hypothetical protein [bacterium]